MLMKISYKARFILLFIMFGAFVVAGSLTAYYVIESKNAKKDFLDNASTIISVKQDRFKQFVSKSSAAVLSISKSDLFKRYIQTKEKMESLDDLLSVMMQSNPDFLSLGFVSADGKELFRFQKDLESQRCFKVESQKLRALEKDEEFREIVSLGEDEIFLRPGKSDLENLPVINVATTVYIDNSLQGYLLLRVNMNSLIDSLQKSSSGYIHLTDSRGRFLIYKDDIYMGSDDFTLDSLFGEMAEDILFADLYVGENMYAQTISIGGENEFKIILQMRSDKLEKKREELFLLSLYLVAIVTFLSMPLAYLFSIIPDKLNKKIIQKSDELAELNKNLEKRVEEEVNIRREKERMLVHQSKMASMGEMIGAIAHQWRQPLNTLSLISMGIKEYFNSGKLDKKRLNAEMDKIANQLQFMSKTIDDFRNFFKPDKNREPFDVAESIQDVITLLSSQIVKHDIEVNFSCLIDGELKARIDMDENRNSFQGFKAYINGFKNEFKQVVLNIVNNAKDAIIEKNCVRKIDISLNVAKGKVIIKIKDNGGGIPEEIIERIFDPYFSTKGDNGTGMGLEMSKTIIEKNMMGSIDVKNVCEEDERECGAEFTIIVAEDRDGHLLDEEKVAKNPAAVIAEDEVAKDMTCYDENRDDIDADSYLNELFEDFSSAGSSDDHTISFIDSLDEDILESGSDEYEEISAKLEKEILRIEKVSGNINKVKKSFDTLHNKFPSIKMFRENSELCEQTLRELGRIKSIITEERPG